MAIEAHSSAREFERHAQPAAAQAEAGEEDELPGERVEIPLRLVVGVGGKIEAQDVGHDIERHARGRDQQRMNPRQDHHPRHHGEDDDIERQYVEIMRHVGQSEKPHQRVGRIGEEMLHPGQGDVVGVAEPPAAGDQQRGAGEEQAEMGDEELPAAIEDPHRPDDEAVAVEAAAERDRRRHARQEHEHVGRIAEPVARRDVVPEDIAAAMRDENDEHRGAAKEIEPWIASRSGRGRQGGTYDATGIGANHRPDLRRVPSNFGEITRRCARIWPGAAHARPSSACTASAHNRRRPAPARR